MVRPAKKKATAIVIGTNTEVEEDEMSEKMAVKEPTGRERREMMLR